jgi:mono/diheme cytochrome c family protein
MHCFFRTFILLSAALVPFTSPARAAEPKPAAPNFQTHGKAFLEKHCVSCHSGPKPKADLALTGYASDQAVLKDRKKWPDILKMAQSGEMPPKEKPRPSRAELEAFVASVNAIFEHADKNAPPDPGRVTVRRLNKVEYNNTIRDLLLVDFNASEDFPSDDVGHGFDNIGDVLTLSPVLFERYLAAAETIANRAIIVNPPKPPVRRMAARYLEPAGPNVPQGRFRPVSGSGQKGVLHSQFALTMDGEHVLKVRCYAGQAGDEPVKIALLVDGKELKRFDVKSTDPKKPEDFEARLTLAPGAHRGAVQFLNEFKKDKDERTLFVESLSMEGPLDTRPAFQRKFLALDPARPKLEQFRDMLTRFVARAYRRPAAKDEVERLLKLIESAESRGDKWEAGMQLAIQAVLVSPKFLFRLETESGGVKKAGGAVALDEFQLASRLSYFLWSTMPDEELTNLAAKKQLSANLDAQVKRMLQDPKAKELVDNFVMQWLQLRNLRNVQPDPTLFPGFNERLRLAMLKETELFFSAIIREDHSILDIIDANFTYLNKALAAHYGIVDTMGNTYSTKKKVPGGKQFRDFEFERVSLQPGTRGGLLTQASILTVTSNPTRTSPVKRGRWVLEQLLGTPPPPPPPNVPELAADAKTLTSASLRQRMEQHRANPACANCHAKMDPLGFAFENFNAVGAFRAKDGNFDIDASGVLPDGKTFKGPDELKAILKEKKDLFSRCLAEKMLIYATGRGLEYYDKRPVDLICANLAKKDFKFSALVSEIVKSEPFRMRRGQ